MIKIRTEQHTDYTAVRVVNDLAFGQSDESLLVDKLRQNCTDYFSLVAVCDEKIVGHIFFSPVTIVHDNTEIKGMGLAPMAVLPDYQNQGIGSQLIIEGLQRISETDYPFVIVLGHAHYYPKFGFERASKYSVKSQWPGVPDEAFMIYLIDTSIGNRLSGVAYYRSEFNDAWIQQPGIIRIG